MTATDQHPRARWIGVLAVVLLGAVAAVRTPLSYLPERSFPELQLDLRLPEPSSLDAVSRNWIVPLEAAVRAVGGVKGTAGEVTTTGGNLRVRFHPGVDVEVKSARLESELATLRRILPEGSQLSLWPARQGSDEPAAIVWWRIDGRIDSDSRAQARQVERQLLDLPEVRAVDVGGFSRQEVLVRPVDPRLPQSAVRAAVETALSAEHLGRFEQRGHRAAVWLDERPAGGLGTVPLPLGGGVVPLAAVSDIGLRATDPWWLARHDGQPGVVFFVSREHEASPLALRAALRQVFASHSAVEGEDYELLIDEAQPLALMLQRLLLGGLAALLTMAGLGGWLGGWRGAALGASVLPLAVAAGFQGLWLARLGLDVTTLPPMTIAVVGALLGWGLLHRRRGLVWGWIAAATVPISVALAGGDLAPMLAEPTRVFLVVLGAASVALAILPQGTFTPPMEPWLSRLLRGSLRNALTVVLLGITLFYGIFVISGRALVPKAGNLSMAALDLAIRVRFPEGGTLEQSARQVAAIEEHLAGIDTITGFWSVVGRAGATVGVTLEPSHRRHHRIRPLVRRLQLELGGLGASVTVRPFSAGAGAAPPMRWGDTLEDRAEFDPKKAFDYQFVLRSTDLQALLVAHQQITNRLRESKDWLFPQSVRTDWRAPAVHLELVPRPGVPEAQRLEAVAAVARRAVWPAGRPVPGATDDLELRVVPADGPQALDDIPHRQDLLALRIATPGVDPSDEDGEGSPAGPLAIDQLFDLRERVASTGIKRQSGRFVLPVRLTLRGNLLPLRLDGARTVNHRLREAVPAGVEVERPSLTNWNVRREQWRLVRIASAFPLLLLAVAMCRLNALWRALAALVAPTAGLVAAAPVVLAARGSLDEVSLTALATILAPSLGVALEVTDRAWTRRASGLAGGFAHRWLMRSAGAFGVVIPGLLAFLLVPGLGVSADKELWVLPLRVAAVAGAVSVVVAWGVVPALVGAGRAWQQRDPVARRRQRRPPEWQEPGPLELGGQRLAKVYGDGFQALTKVEFELQPGIVGLLGPNGAGKTTLLRLLCGLLEPSRGQVVYRGVPVTPENLPEYRRLVGFLPQEFNAYEGMEAASFLDYWALERGLRSRRERQAEIDRVLDQVGLSDVAGRKVRQFSGGMRRRIGIARALLGNPPIVIVDEPTTGLDVESRNRLRESLLAVAGERIIVFSTHIASDIAAAASRILILHRGRLLYDGLSRGLIERAEGRVFEALLSDQDLREFSHRYRVSTRVRVRDGIRVRAVTRGDDTPAGQIVTPNLEEAYLATLSEIEDRAKVDAQIDLQTPKTAAARLLDVEAWRS